MEIYAFIINDEPDCVFSKKDKAMEMFNKYDKYWNRRRFKLEVRCVEVDNENECFSLSYCGRLIGFFNTESEAWKENSKYHKVQFDTNVRCHKILNDLDDYWKGVFDKEIAEEAEIKRIEREAWENLIKPIKHTIDYAIENSKYLDKIQNTQTREQSYELIDTMTQDDIISAVLETYAEDVIALSTGLESGENEKNIIETFAYGLWNKPGDTRQ